MKYTREDESPDEVWLNFEDGTEVFLNPKTGEWAFHNLRRPNLSDLQAIIGIVLEILTLPVGSEGGK